MQKHGYEAFIVLCSDVISTPDCIMLVTGMMSKSTILINMNPSHGVQNSTTTLVVHTYITKLLCNCGARIYNQVAMQLHVRECGHIHNNSRHSHMKHGYAMDHVDL